MSNLINFPGTTRGMTEIVRSLKAIRDSYPKDDKRYDEYNSQIPETIKSMRVK